MDLQAISTMGSAGFLIIFAVVNLAEARTSKQRGSRAWISIVAAIACAGALTALLAKSSLRAAGVLAAMVAVSFAVETVFRQSSGRGLGAERRAPSTD
jgi:hypothetical protein